MFSIEVDHSNSLFSYLIKQFNLQGESWQAYAISNCLTYGRGVLRDGVSSKQRTETTWTWIAERKQQQDLENMRTSTNFFKVNWVNFTMQELAEVS